MALRSALLQAQEIIPSASEGLDTADTSQLLRNKNQRKRARVDKDEIDIKPEMAAEGDQSRELAEMKVGFFTLYFI